MGVSNRLGVRLVDQFISFSNWRTSQKSALLYGLALLLHIIAALLSAAVLPHVAWIDEGMVMPLLWAWTVELGICFVISLHAARKGLEANWTLWLNMIPYGLFLIVFIALFGLISTAFVIWYPSVVVLVAVWYSPRHGLYAFAYGVFLIALYGLLLDTGLLPYGAAVLDREIDVQTDVLWTLYVFIMVVAYFAFCFSLVALLFWTQRVQQARLETTRERLERSNKVIGRYVPRQLAEKIVRGEHGNEIKPERVRLTLVVARIADLAESSDSLDAEEVSDLLSQYLMAMAEIAERFEGTVSQLSGEGVQIFFGAPHATSDQDHAVRATSMALAMQERMSELRRRWSARGVQHPWSLRIGINTGHVSVGDFGSEGRKSYSAFGVQAIIAARIQSRCEPGQVWISDTTWGLLQDQFEGLELGELRLAGLHYPVRAYHVLRRASLQPVS